MLKTWVSELTPTANIRKPKYKFIKRFFLYSGLAQYYAS